MPQSNITVNPYGFVSKQLDRHLEKLNALTHGIGALVGFIVIPYLIVVALDIDVPRIVGVSIYGFSFLFVFISSTLYHFTQKLKSKSKLRILDHISIYYLISGTYTPVLLAYADPIVCRNILIFLWVCTAFGTLFKLIYGTKYDFVSAILYVLMGWSVVFVPGNGLQALPDWSFYLMVIGGVIYSLGVIFYLWERLYYNHVIWHLFVLIAGLVHMSAVFCML